MISPKYANAIAPGGQETMRPDKAVAAKPTASSGNSSFDKMLTASFKEIENKEIIFKKNLFPPDFGSTPEDHRKIGDSKFKEAVAVVFKHEGSAYVSKDGGVESSKFGILQSTAREYGYKGNIKNLSRAEAEGIYKKIWDRSGAASLPYPLSLIHFDTYVNSPAAALKMLKKSGGNSEVYLGMRARRYNRLAELRPERYARYLKGWMNRVSNLRNITTEYAMLRNLEIAGDKPVLKIEDKIT